MDKVSKESVDYRLAAGVRRCGNCVMFHSDRHVQGGTGYTYEGGGTCDLVLGEIRPQDTCDRWEAK